MAVSMMLVALCTAARADDDSKSFRNSTRADYISHIASLKQRVAACRAAVTDCKDDVGPNDRVANEGAQSAFEQRWEWLRVAIVTGRQGSDAERRKRMDEASAHLDELQRSAGVSADALAKEQAQVDIAHRKAVDILNTNEFHNVRGRTWWDRLKARLYQWLSSLFEGFGQMSDKVPWLGRVLEWVLFLGAAVGLVFFLMRTLARQRAQVAMAPASAQLSAWDREANDWASDAERFATKKEWREAVHCLYWAAIVQLEARRAWRHNPSRTPREYVRLLKSGSPQQESLRGLTRILERVWYGLRDAEAADYERAQTLYRSLSSNSATLEPAA
jgi:hypothetical protein